MRLLKLSASLAMLTSVLGVGGVALPAAPPYEPAHAMTLPCPHNACTYCQDPCPGPETWGICFPDEEDWYCSCEIQNYYVTYCFWCTSVANPLGLVSVFDDVWYDNIEGSCTQECLTFSMWLCQANW